METLYWIAFAVYALIVFCTTVVIVLENRQPAKTIAWVVVLTLMPIVGLVVFYFFGQNLRKERLISRRTFRMLTENMLAEVSERRADSIAPKYEPLVRMLEVKNRAVLSDNNRIDIHTSGADFLTALLRDIKKARHHIHIETYIIENDAVGRLLRDALVDKAREGVEVRFLYDDVGCWNVADRFFASFSAGGIEVHPFMPVRFPSLTQKVNYRNHRKVCIIDGQTGYIGGMNFALRYMGRPQPWRDLHLRLQGAAVGSLQRIFLSGWDFATSQVVAEARYFPLPSPDTDCGGRAPVQVVSASPAARFPEIMYGLTWAIHNARHYLYLQTPYFIPSEPVVQALQSAAMAGVDVRLMVPRRPDSFWMRFANDSYFSDMLNAGVRVFTYAPGFLHSKMTVIDDDWCSVGSSNLDFRSFENNFEANAFIYDAPTAKQLRSIFETDLGHCTEVLAEEWKRRPAANRLFESCTRILSPLL